MDDRFDNAFLLAADADIVPAVVRVQERFKNNVLMMVPRGRRCDELNRIADGDLHISKAKLNKCQLPDTVMSGPYSFERPDKWKLGASS